MQRIVLIIHAVINKQTLYNAEIQQNSQLLSFY